MKKIFLATAAIMCLAAMTVSAAPHRNNSGVCSYSPLQDLIRNARSGKDLEPILGGRVDLNAPVKCGGTILQLAIRRGNPEVVKLLLENGVCVKNDVSLDGFSIDGAPN
ncbi:MAG: ankyrin repeat domain-containing protein, partial [Alphaproteobacteria bacterium]|nr:ankyrin repeat domain-containing protein [Alphaproteobacteria bacterium]